MISITLPGKKKQHTYSSYTTPNTSLSIIPKPNTILGIKLQERDDIIKKLYKECKYYVGDTTYVDSTDAQLVEDYGDVEVLHICKNIFDFGKKTAWPEEGHNPLIVTAYSKKADRRFFCTTNYLKKKV